jgi:hypothetical protein
MFSRRIISCFKGYAIAAGCDYVLRSCLRWSVKILFGNHAILLQSAVVVPAQYGDSVYMDVKMAVPMTLSAAIFWDTR